MTVSTRHLVDPQLLGLIDTMPYVELDPETLALMRAAPMVFPVRPEDVPRTEMKRHSAPGRDGAPDVPVIVYRPVGAEGMLPCILHIHGGGYVLGSAAASEAVHRPMAADLGCCIVTVDYRLAPETPHPGPVEDCYGALAWVFARAAELKIDPARIGVMGESAGGGLAAGLALLARDRGEYALVFQHLIYPMIDDRTVTHADPHPHVGEFVWTPQRNHFGWRSLLGAEPGSDGISPYAAAARAGDLAGLPPTYIATGALDLFLEEDLEYARRLTRAGVPVELHVYPGAYHGFQWERRAEVSKQAERDSRAALAKAMRKP
jgi:acetyl esterase/lipase